MFIPIPETENPPISILLCAFNKRIVEDLQKQIKTPVLRPFTPQQESFISAVKNGESVALQAVAGSGKTFTLLSAIRAVVPDHKSLLDSTTIATMNSLGHRAWLKKTGLPRLSIDTSKIYSLVQARTSRSYDSSETVSTLTRLVNMARNFGLVPQLFSSSVSTDVETKTREQYKSELFSLADMYDLSPTEKEIDISYEILSDSIKRAFKGEIDFDDQIFMSAFFRGVFPQFDLVVVDEDQDLTKVQHVMIKRLKASSGQLIAAGDPYQAIYTFRGALSDSIDHLVSTFNLKTMPLSVSFRCPKEIVQEARRFVPTISSSPSAIPGKVLRLPPGEDFLAYNPNVIICRNTAPLVTLALQLLSSGKPCYVLGRDIGKSLSNLIKGDPNTPIPQVFKDLIIYIQSQIIAKPDKEEYFMDRLEAIQVIAADPDIKTRSNLINQIDRLFSEPRSDRLTLSTIHKAKGLEWDTVVFLNEHLIPSKYARQPWQIQAEANLFYVGVTRAKENLIFVSA